MLRFEFPSRIAPALSVACLAIVACGGVAETAGNGDAGTRVASDAGDVGTLGTSDAGVTGANDAGNSGSGDSSSAAETGGPAPLAGTWTYGATVGGTMMRRCVAAITDSTPSCRGSCRRPISPACSMMLRSSPSRSARR